MVELSKTWGRAFQLRLPINPSSDHVSHYSHVLTNIAALVGKLDWIYDFRVLTAYLS